MTIFNDPALRRSEVDRILSGEPSQEPYVPPERYTAPPEDARMTHPELDAAEGQLAAKFGRAKVSNMIHLAHAEAGLGWSENERHAAMYEVQRSLNRHEKAVPADRVAGLLDNVLKLAARQGAESVPGDDGAGYVELTGGLTQESRAGRLVSGDGDPQSEVARLAADHADLFVGLAHPAKSGVRVTTRTRSHASDLEGYHDPVDRKQPARGGVIHPEVKRILEMHGMYFGHASKSYPPKSPAEREREATRARAGGKPQAPVSR